MSRYYRENPDEPIRHDWLTGGKRLPKTALSGEESSTPCAGYATRAEALEAIAERLRNIDWCIGYELTSEQHAELYDIRSIAWSLVSHTSR